MDPRSLDLHTLRFKMCALQLQSRESLNTEIYYMTRKYILYICIDRPSCASHLLWWLFGHTVWWQINFPNTLTEYQELYATDTVQRSMTGRIYENQNRICIYILQSDAIPELTKECWKMETIVNPNTNRTIWMGGLSNFSIILCHNHR